VIERMAYRARQFVRALTAPLTDTGLKESAQVLTAPQRELFQRMSSADRRHANEALEVLQRHGPVPHDLMVAVLLHDVGKAAAPQPLWSRVAAVLFERFAPRPLERLSRGPSQGWRRAFAVQRQHAEIGAEWAAAAGCSALTVSLIRRHHQVPHPEGSEEDRMLASLQAVDGCS
jgi:hypothetical protein